MCITFLFANPGDCTIKYKLILINNRDEFYARKTQKATLEVINETKTIYGVDLAGAVKGTWLGLSVKDDIKIGNLANVTGEEIRGKRGRGPIVTDFIKGENSLESYNEKLLDLAHEFSSFNFLSVVIHEDVIKIFYTSNTPKISHKLPLGFTAMGNSPLSAPFQKCDVGLEKFKEALENHKESTKDELLEALINLLQCKTKHLPDEELTRRRKKSAEQFASVHVEILDAGYGTRTRTVILIDEDNNVDYIEQTMATEDPNGEWETTHLIIPNDSISSQL